MELEDKEFRKFVNEKLKRGEKPYIKLVMTFKGKDGQEDDVFEMTPQEAKRWFNFR